MIDPLLPGRSLKIKLSDLEFDRSHIRLHIRLYICVYHVTSYKCLSNMASHIYIARVIHFGHYSSYEM